MDKAYAAEVADASANTAAEEKEHA
jgi:hypothetical protein